MSPELVCLLRFCISSDLQLASRAIFPLIRYEGSVVCLATSTAVLFEAVAAIRRGGEAEPILGGHLVEHVGERGGSHVAAFIDDDEFIVLGSFFDVVASGQGRGGVEDRRRV